MKAHQFSDCQTERRTTSMYTTEPLYRVQVEKETAYLQGYRVMYRPSPDAGSPGEQWSFLDVRTPGEEQAVVSQLRRGVSYELKVCPFFDEFQGPDSDVRVARTLDEGMIQEDSSGGVVRVFDSQAEGFGFEP